MAVQMDLVMVLLSAAHLVLLLAARLGCLKVDQKAVLMVDHLEFSKVVL